MARTVNMLKVIIVIDSFQRKEEEEEKKSLYTSAVVFLVDFTDLVMCTFSPISNFYFVSLWLVLLHTKMFHFFLLPAGYRAASLFSIFNRNGFIDWLWCAAQPIRAENPNCPVKNDAKYTQMAFLSHITVTRHSFIPVTYTCALSHTGALHENPGIEGSLRGGNAGGQRQVSGRAARRAALLKPLTLNDMFTHFPLHHLPLSLSLSCITSYHITSHHCQAAGRNPPLRRQEKKTGDMQTFHKRLKTSLFALELEIYLNLKSWHGWPEDAVKCEKDHELLHYRCDAPLPSSLKTSWRFTNDQRRVNHLPGPSWKIKERRNQPRDADAFFWTGLVKTCEMLSELFQKLCWRRC